jgi:hypothetical protein
MAQAGFTPIQIYSSSTVASVPSASNLVAGELAINTADGKLFYLDNLNAVQVIGWKLVPVSAGGTGTTTSTGTGSVVLSDAPSLTGAVIIGGATDTATLTLGRSTAAQTINIATGTTAASTTKAVNIGTAGNATSTTNIAIGSATGTSTTTLNGNVTTPKDITVNGAKVGLGAGNFTTNLAIGNQALSGSNTGQFNLAIGAQTLTVNTSGLQNTAFGQGSLFRNTTGGFNTGIGTATLQFLTVGNNNTAVGNQALVAATGSNNIAMGRDAGKNQADGVTTLTTVNNSIYLGCFAKGFNNSDDNSIVIGAFAIGMGANTTVIGTSATTLTKVFGAIQSTTYTVATLPSASTVGVGARAFVTDATTPVFGMAVVGSGAVPVPVYSTGSAWNVG